LPNFLFTKRFSEDGKRVLLTQFIRQVGNSGTAVTI